METLVATVHLLAVDQLAAIIKNRVDKVLIIDSRSFLEFNTCHVLNSVNVCCSKIVKRRLQQDKVSVKEFLTHTCQIDADASFDVVVYDQNSLDVVQLAVDSFIHVLLQKLSDVFKSVRLLRGGFLEFQASHPCLCEDKTRKCGPMTSLSQPCMPISNQGPTRILPFLYLGSQHDALDKELLKNYNITYELNVSTSCPQPEFLQEGHFLRIPVNDNYSEKLLPYFPRAFQFLDKVREANGCVLVHCLAGISRSPTVAIAYVMQHLRMTSDEAYRYVKSKRATISPNFNFLGQLLEYERQLQTENLVLKERASVGLGTAVPTPPFVGHGPKRHCRNDMRSTTAKLSLNLNLPLTATTLDTYVASPETLLMPRPGDQSPTTGIAKLSFNTATDSGEQDVVRRSKVGIIGGSPNTASVFKSVDVHDTKFCQSSRYSSKIRFASLTALKEEVNSGNRVGVKSSYVASMTKRFVSSQVQIQKDSSQTLPADVDMSLPAKDDFVPHHASPLSGNASQEKVSPDREAFCLPASRDGQRSMDVSRDSMTGSLSDSLSSSHCTNSSMCSSWTTVSDAMAPPDYCRSDSTGTSGLGSEISELDSAIEGQQPSWPRSSSPRRVIDEDGVVLRKPLPPCFLLPGPMSTRTPDQSVHCQGRKHDEKSRDSGNPLSPSDKSASEDDKSRGMFNFWEKASDNGNVVASHDSGIVTTPTWAESLSEFTPPKWTSSSSSETKSSKQAGELSISKFPTNKACASSQKTSARRSNTMTKATQDAWSSLVAKHFVTHAALMSSSLSSSSSATTSKTASSTLPVSVDKEEGLYRAQSCPGILTWLQSSPTSISSAASMLVASGQPRPRKLNFSSFGGRMDRFRNRYSCGSLDCTDLIFDSCPDFGHFGRSGSLEMGVSGKGSDRTPLSPTHGTFGRNARVIPVS